MNILDLFKKKNSGSIAKDRLEASAGFRPGELFPGDYGSD